MKDGMIRWIGQCEECGSHIRTNEATKWVFREGSRFSCTCYECDTDINLEPGVLLRGEWVKVKDAMKEAL